MNYPHTKNYNFSQSSSGWKKPFAIGVVILIIYLWGSAIFVDVTSFVVYPLLRISGQIDQNFSDSLASTKRILAENKKLKSDNEKLRVEILKYKDLEGENNQLRGLKGKDAKAENILGRVISKPDHLPYDEMVIDLGTDKFAKLEIGHLVFADNEVVLGQVESVTKTFSKVKLYSSGGMKIPVVVGETAVPSIAEGLGAGNFSLTLPRGVKVKVGDQVKTSIVGNYLLGYAAQIIKDPNDPFQKVLFRSPFNVFELAWVQLSL